MPYSQDVQTVRVFVATWNVGGKSPNFGLDLDDFLQFHNQADIYVLGFQEIVPLNAGNVLVMEDNGPAAKWLSLISQSLNKTSDGYGIKKTTSFDTNTSTLASQNLTAVNGSSSFIQRTSLKAASKTFRAESSRRLKSCNCPPELERKNSKDSCFICPPSNYDYEDRLEDSLKFLEFATHSGATNVKYSLIACKQRVGIFVTVWMRTELAQHVGHLRISGISRGILGCLGNKGCISVSMSFHKTTFCFICSHLASGEKEGDEHRRNSDVIEILKNTQFPNICRTSSRRMPEKILQHDRVIWLGDLNYRIALSYDETRKLLEENNWESLLSRDQLKIEREAGRVFKGWKEGKIYFAPTYKYYYNSNNYIGDTTSKSKRRTPAWCDRILWHGDGIRQLSYVRKESQFSDHRPVCATFLVDVSVVRGGGSTVGISGPNFGGWR